MSKSFVRNSDRGLKFLHNTFLSELIKTYFEFFSKFLLFQGQKMNFWKFQGHIFKIMIED